MAKTSTKTEKPENNLVVGSKMREFVRELGYRCDGDLVQAVSDHLRAVLRNAAARAKAGGRQTIRPTDL